MENNINLAYEYLPSPFKEFNQTNGKQIYDSLMFVPREEKKDDGKAPASLMTLHLSGNTPGLIELIEKKKDFLLKSGHMTIEDQTMVAEILFEHTFKRDKIYLKDFTKLLKLTHEFVEINYHHLNLTLDWRPCFNIIFSICKDHELYIELSAMNAKEGDLSKSLDKLMNKLNKFFPQGSAVEMFNAIKPKLVPGTPQFYAYLATFSYLVPTRRFNTDEDEIQEWLPFILDIWKELPMNSGYKGIFLKLLGNITQNFNRMDFSQYDSWVLYHLDYILSDESNPHHGHSKQGEIMKHFAEYFVNTFKSKQQLNDEEAKENSSKNTIEILTEKYKDLLHS